MAVADQGMSAVFGRYLSIRCPSRLATMDDEISVKDCEPIRKAS